jgi:hypothetical protein
MAVARESFARRCLIVVGWKSGSERIRNSALIFPAQASKNAAVVRPALEWMAQHRF